MRAPQHTTTSDIGGLLPPQHLSQILDVINASAGGRRVAQGRPRAGHAHLPGHHAAPQVLLQSSEKTEGGTLDMQIALRTATASTYIGGNLSWQAINWRARRPSLWFDLAAEQYAIKTEAAACAVLLAAGTTSGTVDLVAGTSTFPSWLGLSDPMAGVYNNSGRSRTPCTCRRTTTSRSRRRRATRRHRSSRRVDSIRSGHASGSGPLG